MGLNALLPLDGSERADRMVALAIKMAKTFGTEPTFFLMGVVEDIPLFPTDKKADARVLKKKGLEYLNKTEKRFEKAGIKTEIVIKIGKPAIEICDYADHNNIDFVLIASHGLGAALRWALGSVTDKVVRHCSKPVVVIKANEKEEE